MRPQKKKARSGRAILMLIFAALLISCVTSPPSPTPIELSLEWPTFPDPADRVYLSPDGLVVMDMEYFRSIVDYKIEIDRIRRILASIDDPVLVRP